jgi:WD40 repeat protein
MAGERVRVFISSPGDVDRERRAAAAIVRRLDREFGRFFAVEPFLWENEPRLGSGHFQDEIDPTEFDVVVLILWSRLGTHLPERTAKREYRGIDGRAPVTGTEWEYEHSRAHADATGGAPALLVFRNHSPAPTSTIDLTLRAQQIAQLEALDRFWQRHFHDQGVFLTAFTNYTRLEEFEVELTNQLRRVLEEFIRRGWSPAAAPAITWFESPFRGLEAYDFKHAPIFYGRDAATRQAVEQLAANAAAGVAFLLVLGASGSGKSSLARAGVLPDLTVANVIPGVRAWRRVVFRPSASPIDLFAGLARQLAHADPEDPGVGLTEIVSDYFPLAQLARHLRENATAPGAPIQLALGQVAAKLKGSEQLHPGEQVRLVVVIDQLEELFSEPAITAAVRERFVVMLANLAHSGAAWVIATMRSDFWHRVAELPLLAQLASDGGRLDLWPPSAVELADIIRQPAAAAGLRFDREHGIGLDEQIAVDAASAPGVLPLLSYTLEALYKRDVERADSRLLLWESYRALGGLHGAIARRADDMVAELHRDAVDDHVIARVLRRLLSFDESEGGRVMARTAPLTDFARGSPERRLVDAFLRPDIRLIVAEGDMTEARVRLAHEALLTRWDRARRLLAEDAINLARRRRLEEAERRWREAEPDERAGLLLRPGLELNEAEALVAAWGDEVQPALRDYIVKSYDAERQREEERHKTAIMLARLSADRALQLIATGDFEAAALLALEALASRTTKPDRPYVPELEAVLYRALSYRGSSAEPIRLNIAGKTGRPSSIASMQASVEANDEFSKDNLAGLYYENWINDTTFSPDGKHIICADRNGHLYTWQSSNARMIRVLTTFEEALVVSYAPNGQYIAIGYADGTVQLRNCRTGRLRALPNAHEGPILSLSCNSDGSRIATASSDGTARLWNIITGKQVAVMDLHTDRVVDIHFSSNGERIITGSWDHSARLWSGVTGEFLSMFQGHDARICSARFNARGDLAVTASFDCTARVWNVATGELLTTIRGHSAAVSKAIFALNDGWVVTVSRDRTLRTWDSSSGNERMSSTGHEDDISDASLSPDGRRVITASEDCTARLWDVRSGIELVTFRGHQGRVQCAVFSPTGKCVVTGSRDGTVRSWAILPTGPELIDSAHRLLSSDPAIVHQTSSSMN